MRVIRILFLLILLATAAQAARIYGEDVPPSPLRFRMEMGVATVPESLEPVLSAGFNVGFGVGYRITDQLEAGLFARIASHDYDEIDGVPLGPGYYEPSWYSHAYGGFVEYVLIPRTIRPFVKVQAGFRGSSLDYYVDRPGHDGVESESTADVGMLALGGGVELKSPHEFFSFQLSCLKEMRLDGGGDSCWLWLAGINISFNAS